MKAAPHVYTFTGNLLAERTLEFAEWTVGKTQRAQRESFQVGGKGVNVSKMLNRLGVPNTALCFTGGAPGTECERWLQERGFAYRAFATERSTRVGTVIRSAGQPETTFLGPDAAPSAASIAACASFLDTVPDGQILAMCGSIPGWSGPEFDPLRSALDRWLSRSLLVVDTYGPPLAWFAERRIALVKINAVELRMLTGGASSVRDILAGTSRQWSARRWVVSDGPHEVWFRDEANAPESLQPPPVREVSSTGSGDVLLACLMVSLFHQSQNLHEAVRQALPYASANAAHRGIAEFP